MLIFKSKIILGSHGPLLVGSPELHARRVKYWDVKGEGEIIGEPGGRPIAVEITLHGSYAGDTPDELYDAKKALHKLIGEHGTLTEQPDSGSAGVRADYQNCTFEGYEPSALPGQYAPGPLKDVSGTLYKADGEPDGGWFETVILHFRQLLVK